MLIGLSLGVMTFITIFTVIINGEFPSGVISFDTFLGNSSQYEWLKEDFGSASYSLDALTGLITVISVMLVLGTIIGIKVLGSGLSDTSIRIIILSTTYLGIWVVLSLFSASLINQIKIFGNLIYISLTVVYVIGVVQKITEGG